MKMLNPLVNKLFPLYLVIFLAFLGYSMMITVFTPMMIYASYGTMEERVFWLGILLGLYSVGQILGTPIILNLATKLGRKKVYLLSLGITAIGYAFIALSLDYDKLIILGFSIFLTGFSESNTAMADQVIIDNAFSFQRDEWISYIEASKSFAFFLGPPFAALLTKIRSSMSFWFISCFLLLTVGWLAYWLPASKPKKMQSSFLKTIKREPFYPFFLNFLAYFAIFGFFRAYPMDLVDRFKFDVLTIGLYIMWVAFPMLLVTLGLNKLFLKFFSTRNLAALGIFISGVFMFFLPFIESAGFLMLATLFLVGLGIGFCLPNAALLISKGLQNYKREQVIEADETFQQFSEVSSSLAGGIGGIFLIQLPLLFFAVSAIAAAILLLIRPHWSKNN
jgi:MFS family permease